MRLSNFFGKKGHFFITITVLGVFTWFLAFSHNKTAPLSVPSSSELGIATVSPSGAAGGAIVPASCATATSCTRVESGGSYSEAYPWAWVPWSYNVATCHGGGDEYTACNQCNACGACNSGRSQCGGACSVGPPSLPAGYGSGCTSVANACGMTNGGSIGCSGSCSATTPSNTLCPPTTYSCTGSVPANASMYSGDNIGLSVNTPYTYWATDTGTRCQYSCNGGFTWNGGACAASVVVPPVIPPVVPPITPPVVPPVGGATHSCTGSVPANASMFSGDNIGLSANTPYTYWATDTGTRCQYSCNGGYSWNGSSCNASAPLPPPPPAATTVSLTVNFSTAPTITKGAEVPVTWSSNGTSCLITSGVGWAGGPTGNTRLSSGTNPVTIISSGNYRIQCTGPGGTASASVYVNAACVPIIGISWTDCDCSTETKIRTDRLASCLTRTTEVDCNSTEKNACRDFNWKEVAP